LMLSPRRANAWADLAQAYARLGDKRASVACFVNAYRWSRNPQQTRTFLERIARSNEDENVRASANSAIGLVAEMPRPGGSGR
jgi:cytochrome c-type biogenesis protein CcmH/NrfG